LQPHNARAARRFVTEGKLPTRIVHISDLHCPAKDPAQPAALSDSIRAAAPDIVAVTGDLTRRARRHEFAIAAELLASLPGVKLVVPGNHDVPLITERFHRPFARFIRAVGVQPLFVETPDVFLIGLNTAVAARLSQWDWSLGIAPEERVAPVAALIKERRAGRLAVVACHHPLRPHALDPRRSATKRGLAAFGELAGAGMSVLLHGHLHRASKTCVPGACEIAANTALSDRERAGPAGYNIIDVDGDGWRARSVAWDGKRYSLEDANAL
jgi:3',5'-cyclic AMP phosphodiesterase CpdA